MFLDSADLADLTPETKLQFHMITSGGRVGSMACRGPLFCPSTLATWEVGDTRNVSEIGLFQLYCFSNLQKGESGLGMRTAGQGGKLDRLNKGFCCTAH